MHILHRNFRPRVWRTQWRAVKLSTRALKVVGNDRKFVSDSYYYVDKRLKKPQVYAQLQTHTRTHTKHKRIIDERRRKKVEFDTL